MLSQAVNVMPCVLNHVLNVLFKCSQFCRLCNGTRDNKSSVYERKAKTIMRVELAYSKLTTYLCLMLALLLRMMSSVIENQLDVTAEVE